MALFSFLRRWLFWKWVLLTLAPCGLVLALLFGVEALGRWTRSGLRGHERFQVAFAEIECTPPANLPLPAFLGEVQSLTGLPGQLDLLGKDLPQVLSAAFRQHPWVEEVERVEVLPGRKVRVQLIHRTPILAVDHANQTRTVDREGVLLPATAATEGLPHYCSPVPPPRGPPGMEWGDPTLKSAAQTIAFLRRQPDLPRFTQVESAVTGLVLTTSAGSRVLWGEPADDDSAHQSAARRKVEFLLNHCRTHGSLDQPGSGEHDLRRLDGVRPITSETATSPRD